MKRAALLTILFVAVLLACGVIAQAQQPKKLPRIGFLSPVDAATDSARVEAIRLALRERGYIEGQNILSEFRYSEGKADRLPNLVAELVGLKVDVIVTGGVPPTRAAISATKTIPIVMTGAGFDPVEAGFVDSLAHPGGNVTGLTLLSGELGGKRLELLKEAFTKVASVAVLYEPAIQGSVVEVKKVLPVAASGLRLTIQPWEIRDSEDIERAFVALNKQRPDALYPTGGPIMRANGKRIADFAIKSRLPSMYGRRAFVDAGGLMSYGANEADSYRRIAYFVDRILKGTKPTDIPVEQPTKFEFVVNLQTAKQIGVTIPQSVLYRADKVIK